MTHSTLFGGSSTTEPITLAAKFTNISPDMILETQEQPVEIEFIPNESKNDSEIKPETIPTSKDSTTTITELPFHLGIGIGVVIGIAIGSVVIFIIRQKPPK